MAQVHFGVSGSVAPLPSERDQNFLIQDGPGGSVVLKIANAGEERVTLEAQNAAMEWVAHRDPSIRVPRVRLAQNGGAVVEIEGPTGRHLVRLLTYVPGATLASMAPHSPRMLQSLGWCLGRLSAALNGFSHPGARRALYWDLATAADLIARHVGAVPAGAQRSVLERLLARFETELPPALARLRRSVIHNDANDHNVLVDGDGRVVGLVDFGDMVESCTVFDLAVGATYAALGQPDPSGAAATVADAYQDVFGVEPLERALLDQLILLRLCLSVTIAAVQSRQNPHNAYLRVSERAAWAAIERLAIA